jgi:iron complex outermembrane receptor protein
MTFHRKTHIATAVAALISLSALPSNATAQEAQPAQQVQTTQNATPVQRVLITGSNIKRIDTESSDPVETISRVDIERSGATTLAQVLATLPSTTAPFNDTEQLYGFAPGASAVSLRNLGKQSTLVLLNGRRVAPYALADFQDIFTNIDVLPLDAIDRIEILRNGASAVYGSDAVAGVVNIITRQDYQGIEVGGGVEQSLTSHSFGEQSLHAAAGYGDMKVDHFNVLANLEVFHRDSVMWRDVMSYADPRTLKVIPQGNAQLSTHSNPGNLGGVALPGCDPKLMLGTLCMYDKYAHMEAQPAADRASLLLSAHAALAPELEAFGELLWSSTKTTYLDAPLTYNSQDAATIWADPTTGVTQSMNYFMLPPGHPLNTTGDYAPLRYRFTDAPTVINAASDNYRLTGGLRGVFSGYDWETALSLLGSATDLRSWGEALSKSGFARLIGGSTNLNDPNAAIDPNFFNIPGGYRIGGQNSPAVLDALFPQQSTHGKLTQAAWDGKVSGELQALDLGVGPSSFATGLELRNEKFTMIPSANVQAGDLVGYGYASANATRTFGALFGELNVPIAKSLETQWAARVDRFPGFGAHFSPKVGLRFQPTDELLLRGTAEGGFRAPNAVEAGQSNMVSYKQMVDTKRCKPANAYAKDLNAQADALPADDPQQALLRAQADQVITNECVASVSSTLHNNPALKPEVSHSYSLGLVFEPLKGTAFTLDYWRVQRQGEIGELDVAKLQATGVRAPLSDDHTFTTPQLQQQYGVTVGPLQSVSGQFENLAQTKTDGIDFGAKTRFATALGNLDLDLQGTYLHNYEVGSSGNQAGHWGKSRWSATLNSALTSGDFVNGLAWTVRSGTTLQDDPTDTGWTAANCADFLQTSAGDCRVPGTLRTDYFFAYNGIRNVTLSAYVRNLFDILPPFDRKALYMSGDVTPQVQEVQRRTLRLAVNYKFK